MMYRAGMNMATTHGMAQHEHHKLMHMQNPNLTKTGLKDAFTLPGLVKVSSKDMYSMPNLASMKMPEKLHAPTVPVASCDKVPATKPIFGMVRLEQH